jgi:cytochrome P450
VGALNQTWVEPDLGSDAFYADPYPTYHQLRRYEPVHWSPQWGGWLLTRYADVVSMLRDPQRFSNVGRMSSFLSQLPEAIREQMRPFEDHFKQGLINSDPPDHTRIRGLLNKAFTTKRVEAQAPQVEVLVDELLDKALRNGQMDVIADFSFLIPTTVIAHMLGVPLADRDQFAKWAEEMTAFVGTGRVISELAAGAQTSLLELREYFRRLIAARRVDPQDDLVTALATAEDRGSLLNEAELLSVCVTLLLAGFGTTMTFIGNAVLALLRHPDIVSSLRRDPSLMPAATEELLRYDGPIHRQWRIATEDIELHGMQIRKGQLVAAMLGAADRDPEQFPNPDRLDITRAENYHVAFGSGIHFCLGAPLARLESQIALKSLIRRCPKMQLADENLNWRRDITIHGLNSLPVSFV